MPCRPTTTKSTSRAWARPPRGSTRRCSSSRTRTSRTWCPSKGDVGSDVVWDALDEFKGRWEEGVNNLCQDVEEMAGRLGKIAMNYFETDKAGYDALSALKGTIAAIKVM